MKPPVLLSEASARKISRLINDPKLKTDLNLVGDAGSRRPSVVFVAKLTSDTEPYSWEGVYWDGSEFVSSTDGGTNNAYLLGNSDAGTNDLVLMILAGYSNSNPIYGFVGGGSDFKIEYGVSRDAETGDDGNVWNKTTNEVYLTPCVDFSDPTPTGEPALPCDIYTPNNIDIRNAVIEPSKIYAYVRIYHTVDGVTSFRGLILPTEHGVKVMSQSVSGTTSTTLASYYGVKEIAFNSSNIAVDKIDDRSVRVTVNDPVGEEVTVVTAVQVNTTTLTLEVKTRTITVLAAGAESDWTTVIEGTDCNSSSSSSSSSSSATNLCVTGESLSPDVTGTYIPSEPLGGDDIWTRSTPNADYYIDRDPVSGDAWIRSSANGDYLFEARSLLGTYTPIDPSTGTPTVAECGGA